MYRVPQELRIGTSAVRLQFDALGAKIGGLEVVLQGLACMCCVLGAARTRAVLVLLLMEVLNVAV